MEEDEDPRVARARELEKRLGEIRALLRNDEVQEADKALALMQYQLSYLTRTPQETENTETLIVTPPASWL